jgi:hypothetical protein
MDREARNALVRAHQNNINRYCRLLATDLTELERDYVRKRIVEETHQLEKLLKPPRRHNSARRLSQTCSQPATQLSAQC